MSTIRVEMVLRRDVPARVMLGRCAEVAERHPDPGDRPAPEAARDAAAAPPR